MKSQVSFRGTVSGSPLLLHNICSDDSSALVEPNTAVSLRSSPFGSRQPTIPVARSITIARVASPITVDRRYQNLCLSALKSYFETTRRLVKNGDIIALPLDTDAAQYDMALHDGKDDIAPFIQ